MTITFDPAATVGKQYTVAVDSHTYAGIAQLDVLSIARRHGVPLKQIRDLITEARLATR